MPIGLAAGLAHVSVIISGITTRAHTAALFSLSFSSLEGDSKNPPAKGRFCNLGRDVRRFLGAIWHGVVVLSEGTIS